MQWTKIYQTDEPGMFRRWIEAILYVAIVCVCFWMVAAIMIGIMTLIN